MGDNGQLRPYAQAMERGQPYIRLRLEVPEAIELGNFVSAFTSLAGEYDRYMRGHHPATAPDASLFVSEVRKGSIEAILIPMLATLPAVVDNMSQVLTVEDFVRRYGARLSRFLRPTPAPREDTTKSELKDFAEQVAAIASVPGSNIEIAAIEIKDGDHKVKAAIKFNTTQAREIEENVAVANKALEHRSRADHSRVLMVFTRSDVTTVAVGKSTGERVKIESLSDRSLPLIYASELAEEQIKHEITEAEDNVFKKGFVVDVNVESRQGRPVAYRVTHLHQVIDIEDDN